MKKLFRGVLTLFGLAIGLGVAFTVNWILGQYGILFFQFQGIIIYIFFGLILAITVFLLSSKIIKYAVKHLRVIEGKLSEIPIQDIILGSIGLIIGLFIAFLISDPITKIRIPLVASILTAFIYILFGYLGIALAINRRDELGAILHNKSRKLDNRAANSGITKVLDTSVIIDGRIFDICETGFIEGPLIIPSFVLLELRHIADSSDSLKRNRGRRGLDILNKIQKELDIDVEIYEDDVDDADEVDIKLLKLGEKLGGKVITNDYNLNKVAEFQGVPVLNINELANAVKPVVLPGEYMAVQVVKDGKETGQGIAYLDDGTMIVVDGGKKFVGKTIDVLVTSVLQTAAGRMIFAKPKESERNVS